MNGMLPILSQIIMTSLTPKESLLYKTLKHLNSQLELIYNIDNTCHLYVLLGRKLHYLVQLKRGHRMNKLNMGKSRKTDINA